MKVSIITVNLNNASGLAKTLESVRSQQFRDFEHIVIDGGSSDGSVEQLRLHADSLAHWVSEPDEGIYAAMNKGRRAASGEYVYFLNSGDWLAAPNVLESFFADGRACADLLYGDSIRSDGKGGTRYGRQPNVMTVAPYLVWGFCHQTIFYKRELFERLGGYDERLRFIADWDFTIRALLARCSTKHLPLAVAFYDAGGHSASAPAALAAERCAVLSRLLPDAVLRDLERLRALELEQRRWRDLDRWVADIRQRNFFVNLAMIVKWGVLRKHGSGAPRAARCATEGRTGLTGGAS